MPLTGGVAFLNRLKRARDISGAMDDWAFAGASDIAVEARNLVNENGAPSPEHIVSAPGAPPNTDTGNLQSQIKPVELPETAHAAAVSGAEYATALEFGTTNMVERPYMRVATANRRASIINDAAKRVASATRKR